MNTKTRTKDRGSLNPYRTEIPNLIDDWGLSVYAFRLYVHLKRVAGETGSCWESARTLATACNMSAGQVSKAKDELEAQGLIVRHIKLVRGGVADDIAIADIWPQNFRTYMPESDHSTITSREKVITPRSLTESDHSTITSEESDQEVIAESVKRSYSDPKKYKYHIERDHESPTPTCDEPQKVGGGDDTFYQELRRRKIGPTKAREIADKGGDVTAILFAIDHRPNPDDPRTLGRLILDILDGVIPSPPLPDSRTAPQPSVPLPQAMPPEQLRAAAQKYDWRTNGHAETPADRTAAITPPRAAAGGSERAGDARGDPPQS